MHPYMHFTSIRPSVYSIQLYKEGRAPSSGLMQFTLDRSVTPSYPSVVTRARYQPVTLCPGSPLSQNTPLQTASTSGTSPAKQMAKRTQRRIDAEIASLLPVAPTPAPVTDTTRPTRSDISRAIVAQYGTPAPKRPPTSDKIRITFDVYEEFAPALRSAIDELSTILGSRATGSHRFSKEQAITDAIISVAALRVAVFAAISAGDPNYV